MPSLQPKSILSREEARQAILRGVTKLADTVAATLGPRGRVIVLDRVHGSPLASKDGYTVAKEINLSDPYENIGAQLVKEAAEQTVRLAGDGTTTAVVLAQAIYREGVKLVAAGANPMALKRGIDKATAAIIGVKDEHGRYQGGTLATLSQPVEGDMIAQVGTISANSDASIGLILASAMAAVGRDGVVTVEESRSMETTLDVVEGMQWERGWLSPYFVTNPDRAEVSYEASDSANIAATGPLILLLAGKLTGLQSITQQLMPFLSANIAPTGRSLLIVAEDVEHEPLSFLIVNRLKGLLSACAVKSPGFGDRRKALLDDLAVLTGATVIGGELGIKLETAAFNCLGTARSIIVSKDSTTILDGGGKQEAIQQRIAELKLQIDRAESDYDREKLAERLAKLTGGVAVIKVGAATEAEMKEKKARVEDAMHATRAAVAEGVVAGGGTALLIAADLVEQASVIVNDRDEESGVDIVHRACEEPLRQIAANAGKEGAIIVGKVRDSVIANYGWNAATDTYCDMILAGILDPTRVTRTALQSAASIAGLMLTTEALVTDDLDAVERLRRLQQSGPGMQQPGGQGQQGY